MGWLPLLSASLNVPTMGWLPLSSASHNVPNQDCESYTSTINEMQKRAWQFSGEVFFEKIL